MSLLGSVSHQLRIRKNQDSSEEIRRILGQENGFGKKIAGDKVNYLILKPVPAARESSEVVPTGTESSRPSIVFEPSDAALSFFRSLINREQCLDTHSV